MKIKCPHCQFKFNTNENLKPPFKIGQRVKFVKKYLEKYWSQGFRNNFDYSGKVIGYKLIRAESRGDGIKKDGWLINVEYLPFSKRYRLSSKEFWDYEIKSNE